MILVITTSMALFLTGVRVSRAQDKPPDLQMLLNLDLFGARPPSDAPDNSGGDAPASMLDQIRALDAMGYLGPAGRDSLPPEAPSPQNDIPNGDRTGEYGTPQL